MTNTWSLLPYPTPAGQVGGHEGVGKIVKLGTGTESSHLKIGDRVGVKWISSACGHCRTLPVSVLFPQAFQSNIVIRALSS